MSQNYVDNVFTSTGQVQSQMAQIENNFAALKSIFSGTSAPPDTVAGMLWFHTTNKIPKLRNNANDAWLGIMQADASHKLWVYRNTAPDGWVVDSSITDKVLALKGGTQAYNANGGTTGGSFTLGSHTLTDANLNPHTHGSGGGSHTHTLSSNLYPFDTSGAITVANFAFDTRSDCLFPPSWVQGSISYFRADSTSIAHTHTSVGSSTPVTHDANYRPAAAIGTMQYMNI